MNRFDAYIQDHEIVKKAYAYASKKHEGITRLSGEPYITHCFEVAKMTFEFGLDEKAVAAAFLHDVVEDTKDTVADIEKIFDPEIAFLVDGLTKIKRFKATKEEQASENLRKLILSFSKDLRVVIIKLADRFHNMKTLSFQDEEHQRKISWETMEIYAPIAYRLGMQQLSGDLEDLAFPYLYPEAHEWLIKEVKEEYEKRKEYIKKITPLITQMLKDAGIECTISARAKRLYSLYRKLQRYDMNLDKIYDLIAFRIIVHSIEDCYAVLGAIHRLWQPLPGQFDDYISRPKPNGYKSLHTTVFCIDNKITEFQIRTQAMHEENEFGIAAHWAYQQIKSSKKHSASWKGVANRQELLWVEQLRNWQKSLSQKDFLESIKVDFFKDRIFALTPQNDVLDLPAGSTPVDFAYRIHSEIGDQCVGAKVNNKHVSLDYELHSGDIVEIVMQKGKKPSKAWLAFVKSPGAKKHISNATKPKFFIKPVEQHVMEFKIVNTDRSGYLKDITNIFAEHKINITYLSSQTYSAFSNVLVRCALLPKQKTDTILLKIRKVSGTKEVSVRVL